MLLDVQLPDQDGFAVATAVVASQGPAVVLISSREADAYGRRVVSCGARGFIPKSKLSAAISLRRSSDVGRPRSRDAADARLMRDPVIVAPLVVAAGLAVGALGIQAHVSETRIATDMGVAWALAAAALVTLGRPRRRRATWLLAAAAFALLGADLEWADTHAWWTLGLVFEQLWIAVLAVFDAHSGIGSASGHGHRRRSRGSPNRHWLRTSRPAPSTGCARRDARDRQPADTRDNGPRRAPMRVVIADDAPLIREKCHTSAHRKCHRSSRPGRRRRRAARMCPRTSPGRRAR